MTARHRPALWQAAAAFIVANACALAYTIGLSDEAWLAFWTLFLILELSAAADSAPGNTFSERWWEWSGVRPRRPGRWHRAASPGPFLVVLILHLYHGGTRWWDGGLAVIGTSLWPAAVVAEWWWARLRARLVRLGWLPEQWECVPGDEPRCYHATLVGALIHRWGSRETGRLP